MAKCAAIFTVLLLLSVFASLSQGRTTRVVMAEEMKVVVSRVICPACVCCEPAANSNTCCRCCAAPIETQSQTSNP
ncbi:hypothetical protein SUGI_0001820 [Cryptomeria japonica]|uniref:uncharacterized protein LOC131876471 n=1 Tax=Cryptomeria japonica TaxID=3369 RepID=UPI002408A87B|nr:uncharacterized protein LOC131876471 [Cryptomeria japonica]GLJ04714.1 hypothetical protein SUGI_0001820 [Cryptomeria japonica]